MLHSIHSHNHFLIYVSILSNRTVPQSNPIVTSNLLRVARMGSRSSFSGMLTNKCEDRDFLISLEICSCETRLFLSAREENKSLSALPSERKSKIAGLLKDCVAL